MSNDAVPLFISPSCIDKARPTDQISRTSHPETASPLAVFGARGGYRETGLEGRVSARRGARVQEAYGIGGSRLALACCSVRGAFETDEASLETVGRILVLGGGRWSKRSLNDRNARITAETFRRALPRTRPTDRART